MYNYTVKQNDILDIHSLVDFPTKRQQREKLQKAARQMNVMNKLKQVKDMIDSEQRIIIAPYPVDVDYRGKTEEERLIDQFTYYEGRKLDSKFNEIVNCIHLIEFQRSSGQGQETFCNDQSRFTSDDYRKKAMQMIRIGALAYPIYEYANRDFSLLYNEMFYTLTLEHTSVNAIKKLFMINNNSAE